MATYVLTCLMVKKKIFSETKCIRPTVLIFGMWQWLMVLYIICANHAPGAKFGHASGVDSLHRLTIGKYSNINISKTSGRILVKLHTQHHLAIGKIALLFFGRSDLNSGCHGNIYILMWEKKSLKPQGPQL